MPAVKSSLVHPAYKTECRVRNWHQDEQRLRVVLVWSRYSYALNPATFRGGSPQHTAVSRRNTVPALRVLHRRNLLPVGPRNPFSPSTVVFQHGYPPEHPGVLG